MHGLLARFAQTIIDPGELGIPEKEADAGTLSNVIGTAFLLAGGISVIFIVVGGMKYVLSTGDPQQTLKAKNTIMYAVVGLIFSLLAFVIVRIVTQQLE